MTGQPSAGLYSSPTVFQGRVYIGSNTGIFYALDIQTGTVIWQRFIGFVPAKTCGARGFVSTATVAHDPVTKKLVVYVGAADGNLYALDASSGNLVWKSTVAQPSATVNDYYIWSSPTVMGGHIYIGISSQCDHPLVRGGLVSFDQATGNPVSSFYTVPDGSLGGSVWTSAAATSDGFVWITTGNEDPNSPSAGDSISILRLSATTLAAKGIWIVPAAQQAPDGDFSSSPTIFTGVLAGRATRMVGACNKNGLFYALQSNRLSTGPVWTFQVGNSASSSSINQCNAAAIWDGSRLYVASNTTEIDGVTYNGSIRQLDASTGIPVWETGLPAQILGTPTEDGAGVIATASWDTSGAPQAAYLLDASSGTLLTTLSTSGSKVFAQPVFADGYLLLATQSAGLIAYRPA